MEQSQYNFLFSFIWNIANDVLVNAFNKGDYKKVILPMLVLRRIDVLLEPTKDAVIQMKEQLDKNKIENQAPVLYDITGYPFYNTSKFTMKTLKSEIDPLRLKMNFIEYLNGYSKDVLDIGDCQMLFLANNLSRMVDDTELGTRIVEVHNGSSLFTGNAGSGASNLRQYIIENDMLEAIIAMPENDFYNTGIGTYIWVVTNRKEERRKGYVQLIDATDIKSPLRKNLGKKNCETNEADRNEIVKMLLDFKETKKSKIFPNKEFGYYSVTVERPLRLVYENLDEIALPDLKNKGDVELLQQVVEAWKENLGGHTVGDFALFLMLEQMRVKVPASKVKLVRQYLGKHNDKADVCFTKPTKRDSAVVTDPSLRDTEQVPLLYSGGIDAFMEKEVLPYAPDAFYDAANVVVGYELSFTKYFYKPVELRTIADITTDINGIEGRLKGVLKDILNV